MWHFASQWFLLFRQQYFFFSIVCSKKGLKAIALLLDQT